MKCIKIVGLCLIATFAMSLAAAATASAVLPEWGKCVVGGLGTHYTDAGCTQPGAGGTHRWKPAPASIINHAFTSVGGGAELETTTGLKVNCTSETAHGELSGNKNVAKVDATFEGCKTNITGSSVTCTNTNPPTAGEVTTFGLKGGLGFISGKGAANPPPVVGLSLQPENAPPDFKLLTQFICGGFLVVRVGQGTSQGHGRDSIISPITPVT
jgi:hypothetical protein